MSGQFQNLPSCNESMALLQISHVLSTQAVSTINSNWHVVNKGENWWWKGKMVNCHQWTSFWTQNLNFSAAKNNLWMWLEVRSMSRNYFSSVESEFCSKCYSHKTKWHLHSPHTWTQRMWIFPETKTCKCFQWHQKGSLFLVFRLHASWTRWCKFNIGTNNISWSCWCVPLFGSHFASKNSNVSFSF